MLLPQTKEREYRFKLALRMGLPIFGLILALISSTFITTYEALQPSFYITSLILLVFSIYFILFLIYRGFDVRVTDNISKTFTRDYLYEYLEKELKLKKEYTLILISIDNLHDINTRYGIKNGDKVIYEVVQYVGKYFKDNKIKNFPMGHIKGGDFIIGLENKKEDYNTILELFCLKSSEFRVEDIEVNISGAILDTSFSSDLDHMVEKLFEQQQQNKKAPIIQNEISPSDLETYVIRAINAKTVIIFTQDVYEGESAKICECFVKLKSDDGKILYPKSYMKVVNRLGLTAEYDFLIVEKIIAHCVDNTSKMYSISISPSSLRNSSFLSKVKELLHENPHTKGRIIFMLSEVEYYAYVDRYNTTLQSIKKSGVQIAIDRLGSLHTSFLYLKDLEIDMVRFDSSYTKDINKARHRSILNGFNKMAHNCGVKTWMKMVENQEIQSFVEHSDIDYMQGNILSKLEKIYED